MPRRKKSSAEYRCAKCRHRLDAAAVNCAYCRWTVDPVLAKEEARLVDRNRRRERDPHGLDSTWRKVWLVAGILAICAILVLFLHVINR